MPLSPRLLQLHWRIVLYLVPFFWKWGKVGPLARLHLQSIREIAHKRQEQLDLAESCAQNQTRVARANLSWISRLWLTNPRPQSYLEFLRDVRELSI